VCLSGSGFSLVEAYSKAFEFAPPTQTVPGESIGVELRDIEEVMAFLMRNGHKVITYRLTDIVYNPLNQVRV
jgi:hypothetical protein